MTALAETIGALEAVLTEAVNNSKIINTIDKEISKALGLLIDLILLPFLPLLVGGIMMLYAAVLGFGKWWNDVTGVLKKEGLLGLIKLSLEAGITFISGIVEGILKFLFGTDEEKEQVISATLKVIDDFVSNLLPVKIIAAVLDFLFGEGTSKMVHDSIVSTLSMVLPILGKVFESILNFVFGIPQEIKKALTFDIEIPDPMKTLSGIIIKILNYIFGEQKTKEIIEASIKLTKENPLDTAWKVAEGVGGAIIGGVKGILGIKEQGGYIGETGPYILHKGENVIPAGKSGGSNTFNFYGLTPEQLPEQVRRILRQDGSGYVL